MLPSLILPIFTYIRMCELHCVVFACGVYIELVVWSVFGCEGLFQVTLMVVVRVGNCIWSGCTDICSMEYSVYLHTQTNRDIK